MKLPSLALALGISFQFAHAENWPAWRGPNGSGVVSEVKGPQAFSKERSWQKKLAARACSTPVVWDGKVFVTGLIGEQDSVQCFDLKNGDELWKKELGPARLGRTQRIGSSANSSPITDGKALFVYFKSGTVASLSFDGKVKWSIKLDEVFPPDKLLWDRGTSPVLAGGHLVIAVLQQKGTSYLGAINPADGKKVWMTERPHKSKGETGDSYSSPFVTTIDGVETIVTWGADQLTGHNAKSGKLIWHCGGFNPTNHAVWRSIASPAATEGVAIVPFGREEFVGAIKMGGKGDITDSAWLWKKKGWGSDTTTPAAHRGLSLVLTDRGKNRGTLTMVNATSGDLLWQETLPKSVHTFCASPTVAGRTVYVARQDGTIFAGDLSREGLANVRQTTVDDGIIASPVVVDGRLLVRSDGFLTCFW